MKIKNKLLSALLIVGINTATYAQVEDDIKVMIKDLDGEITKTVIVNGKQLNAQEIADFEADGKIKIISLDDVKDVKSNSMVFVNTGEANESEDNISVSINTNGDKVTKKITMNGKELNAAEIKQLEASGKLKSLNIDATDIGKGSMHKVMFFNTDKNANLDGEHEIEVQTKIISLDDNHATLGMMTNVKNDGWHIISVVEGSGAEDAGLKAGDIVKFMGDLDLSNGTDNLLDNLKMTEREVGDMVDLEVERDGKLIYMSVEARQNNSFDMAFSGVGSGADFSWTDELQGLNLDSLSNVSNVKIMVMNSDSLGKSINFNDMDINLPEMLGNMNIFMTDGNSTSKLLGKNHEMSTLSKGLESYFKTKGGVLIMHVDEDNVFGLKDGDVIKKIDGVKVTTPKEVIKQLLKADDQNDINLKVVRHKKNKTLKYNK